MWITFCLFYIQGTAVSGFNCFVVWETIRYDCGRVGVGGLGRGFGAWLGVKQPSHAPFRGPELSRPQNLQKCPVDRIRVFRGIRAMPQTPCPMPRPYRIRLELQRGMAILKNLPLYIQGCKSKILYGFSCPHAPLEF